MNSRLALLRSAGLGLGLVLTLLSAPVAASDGDEKTTRAVQALRDGNRLFDENQFDAALQQYQAAYAIVQNPKLFFNIAQALRRLGRTLEALDYYERFLKETPAPASELRADARTWIQELGKNVGALRILAQPGDGAAQGAVVRVDGTSVGTTPLAAPVRVLSGEHEVIVSKPEIERPFRARVGVRGRETVDVTAVLGLPPAVPPVPEARAPGGTVDSSTDTLSHTVRIHQGRLGLTARVDLDPALAGAGGAFAVTWGVLERLDLALGALVWPGDPGAVAGTSLGGTVYMTTSRVRPLAALEGQIYFRDGAHWAARAALGLHVDANAHLGGFVTAGLEHTSTSAKSERSSTFFVPSLGAHARY